MSLAAARGFLKIGEEMNMREYVYFIGSALGPIKIGRAKNIRKRLAGLQTSHPHKLTVLGVLIGKIGEETTMHEMFAQFRLNGEWFSPHEELIDFIKKCTIPFDEKLEREMQEAARLPNLRNHNVDLKRFFDESAFEQELRVLVSEAMRSWIAVAKEIYVAIDEIENAINVKHGEIADLHPLRLMARRVINKTIESNNWHDGDEILYAKETERADKLVEFWARDWVKARYAAYLSGHTG